MKVEQLTPSQIGNIQKLDNSLNTVKRLQHINPKSEVDTRYYNEANLSGFEAYWNGTREIFMKEGKMQILVDDEMRKVYNTLLEQKGFKQSWG